MRNFTLGKRGLSMLFFAFFLLIGNSPTFAQSENCPTVSDNAPDAFCYLSTIADLTNETGAQANGDGLRWYRTSTSTTPIPNDELLRTGTYYAGNVSGNCTPGRIAVDVTVDDAGAPTTQFGNTFAPCEYDEADISTVQDLIDNVDGNEVEIFATEFGDTAMNPATRLVEGNSYFAGQRNPDTNCRTSRIALRYDPVLALAPTAEALQQFCTGATVADLEATFTSTNGQAIRWYSTLTSSPALASTTPLVDGEEYFASQIVNRSNSNLPPCESTDRFRVVVELIEAEVGAPQVGIVCTTEVGEMFPSENAIENFLLGLLDPSAPTGGTFSPNAGELANEYQNTPAPQTGDFTTTYSVGDEGCEYTVELTIRVIESQDANAGTIAPIIVDCEDDTIVILDDTLLSENATRGGTFTGEGVNEDGNFDPAIGPGVYEIRYFVNDEQDCVIEGTEDETFFTITVEGATDLGDPIVMEMCVTEAQDLLASPAQAEAFFNNILAENGITNLDGSFDLTEEEALDLFAFINSNPVAPRTFNTIYTVTSSCGEESVEISLTINNTEAPNAGPISPAPVCASATLFDLFTLLGANNDSNGTFSYQGEVIVNGLFDVEEMGTFPITYTVTESDENCTAGEPNSTEFTLTVTEGFEAESPDAAIVCEADVDALFPSFDEIRKFYTAMAQEAGFPTNGTFNPTPREISEDYQRRADKLGNYNTTYTFGEGDCQTSVELTITVIASEDANAGTIQDVTVDCDDQEVIVLASLPNDGGNTTGTFSGEGVTNGNFDPSIGPGTYTITYTVDDTATCVNPGTSDTTTFTIRVQGTNELPEAIAMEMCITEVQDLLANPAQAEAFFNNLLTENGITNLEGDFDDSIAAIGLEIISFINSNPTASRTFGPITYTITSDCGVESVDISLTINNTEAPNAGEITPAPVCASETSFDLFTLLGVNNDMGGTFSDEDGNEITDGLFNVSVTGPYSITYTVTESDENCTAGEPDSTTFTLNVNEGAVAVNPAPEFVCLADVDALFPSFDEIRKFYTAIAQEAGFPTNGTFNPTPREISAMYQADQDGLGSFTTTYTFGEGDCQATVDLTVTVVENADAGENGSVTLTTEDDAVNLFDYIGGTPMANGTWSNGDGMFDPSTDEEGVFTYTVTLGSCTDTATVTVTVEDETDPTDPTVGCAGEDVNIFICEAQVAFYIANPAEAAAFFASIIAPTVDQSGTFSPSLESIAAQWLNNPVGTFNSIYTVDNDDCEDSAAISIVVSAGDQIVRDTVTSTVCESDVQALFPSNDEIRKYFLNLVPADISRTGTFSPNAAQLAALYQADEDGLGDFATTYTVQQGECSVSIELILTVVAAEDASTGDIADVEVCTGEETLNLFDLLDSENNTLGGTFSNENGVIANGILDVTIPGEYEITYTVSGDDTTTCLTGTATTTFMVTSVEGDANAGTGATLEYCITEIEAMTPQEAVAIFNNLLPEDIDQNGVFSPSIAELIADFMENPIGTFTTEYTVGEAPCQDTAEYVIIINDLEEANAGSDTTISFCATQGSVNLSDFLNDDANQNGNFEGLEDNMFNPSEAGIGTYTFTYTVDASVDCVIGEDSATYTIEVVPSTVNAGPDNSTEVCLANVDAFGNTQVRNLFLSLLDDEVSREGTFSPTIAEIITQYNTVGKVGDFTTTYTVGEDGCEDSVELTVTVIQPNDAGTDMALTFCSTQGPISLFDFLSSNATLEGSFEGYEDGIFDPSTATLGVTTITYEVEEDDNVCTTGNFTSTLTITVVEPQDANAGGDVAVTYCVDQDENIDLTTILGDGAITLGSFSAPYANGIFNPATAGLGEYVITYSINGEEDCAIGSDSATITITVAEAVAEAPVADANQFFCLGEGSTVADLVATGNNVVWYTDAALENVALATTPLTNGSVFYAISAGDTACETSEAVMVTVTLQDSMSPTLPNLGNEFCRQDNPTVQDLIDNFSGSNVQIYSSATGGTALATTTAIQNEVTYYATATDASLCESTERVAVNARVRFCGIPEGFSPNGDNINDRFVIPDIRRDYPNFSIEIFNRWGNVVYKGNASMPDWDGVSNQSSTLGDNVLPAGVYFYILNYNDGTTTPVQGKLYLSR